MLRQEYLRPHDVLVLLQLAIQPVATFRELSAKVGLSLGEVHKAAKRLGLGRLIIFEQRSVNLSLMMEFLVSGVPYAFPAQIGAPSRGIPTAFSAPPLAPEFMDGEMVVWPAHNGRSRGLALTPLSPAVSTIWEDNHDLYRALTLIDALRVGRARERKRAREYLVQMFDLTTTQWS